MALLTLAWGGSLLLGRCDLDARGRAVPRTLTRGAGLLRTGVTADADVRSGAGAMLASLALYAIVQVRSRDASCHSQRTCNLRCSGSIYIEENPRKKKLQCPATAAATSGRSVNAVVYQCHTQLLHCLPAVICLLCLARRFWQCPEASEA